MIHGINKQVLYSAVKIEASFENSELQKSKTVTGTAFFCKIKDALLLVTNRHVLELSYRNSRYSGFHLTALTITGRLSGDDLTQISVMLPVEVIFHADERNDVAAIRCEGLRFRSASAVKVDYFIPEGLVATFEDFQSDIEVCDFVAFPGYPQWHDQVEVRPILRVGTIASDPSKNYHYGQGDSALGGDCVAYEAFSYGGSSGSPVFALQKGIQPGVGIELKAYRSAKFIGINGGHLPSSDLAHSGVSYFYRSSLLFDMV